jgi:peptidylprolyl isomerase
MKHTTLILMLAASALAASAQTTAKPAAPAVAPAKPASSPAAPKLAATAAKIAAVSSPLVAPTIKAPASIPQYKGLQKAAFTIALRYQEIQVGTGPVAELNKLYKVQYTGYRAADGVKFDSSLDRPGPPLKDKDGKPVLGDDGKPKLDVSQPVPFPQGKGAFITGFDQGVVGMKIGGKRRLFIPWQLGYGTREIPERPGHPGIPAKSDLIFDVELVDVTDIPVQPARPNIPGGQFRERPMPNGQAMPPRPGTPGAPGSPVQMMAPTTVPKPPVPPAPAGAPSAAAPATPAAPGTTPATTPTAPAPPQPK